MVSKASLAVSLDPELEDFVSSHVAEGRYQSADELVATALLLLRQQEALLPAPIADLQAKIAVGLAQANRGELLDGDQVFREIEEMLENPPSE